MDRLTGTIMIDGNNLAYFLYTNLQPDRKMTNTDNLRLIAHLQAYCQSLQPGYQVELCLDRFPGEIPSDTHNLRIFWAEYPQTGDDLLLGRFWFHHISQRPCLVVSNDEAILEEVTQAAGNFLRVYDFVRRPGLKTPVFRYPDEFIELFPQPELPKPPIGPLSLSASIYFRIGQEHQQRKEKQAQPKEIPEKPFLLPPVMPLEKQRAPLEEPDLFSIAEPDSILGAQPHELSPAAEEQPETLYYFLTLDQWPVEEGVRFIKKSFCPQHAAEYQDLIDSISPASYSAADLRALVELLLVSCGDEPDFSQRGALMDRVRLALLKEKGEPLTLDQIAARTGLKQTGLQGRIKAKAGRWVEILRL